MNPLQRFQYSLRWRGFHFNLHWFMGGFICFCIMAWFFNSIKPEGEWIIGIGMILLSVTVFCFINAGLQNIRRTSILMSGFIGVLLLRVLKLHDILYYLTLFAFVVSLEFATRKK